jgi:hypothetical protein
MDGEKSGLPMYFCCCCCCCQGGILEFELAELPLFTHEGPLSAKVVELELFSLEVVGLIASMASDGGSRTLLVTAGVSDGCIILVASYLGYLCIPDR